MSSHDTASHDTARLFVALDIPDSVRGEIETWQACELTDPALRPVVAANLHLTLCFIGPVHIGQIPEIAATVLNLAARPVPARFTGLASKPAWRPGVIALEVASPAAVELQASLAAELGSDGVFKPESRPFWPHLTVARVRNERGKRRPQRVGSLPDDLPAALLHPWNAVRLALYRSNIRSCGAHYESLAELNLPPTA